MWRPLNLLLLLGATPISSIPIVSTSAASLSNTTDPTTTALILNTLNSTLTAPRVAPGLDFDTRVNVLTSYIRVQASSQVSDDLSARLRLNRILVSHIPLQIRSFPETGSVTVEMWDPVSQQVWRGGIDASAKIRLKVTDKGRQGEADGWLPFAWPDDLRGLDFQVMVTRLKAVAMTIDLGTCVAGIPPRDPFLATWEGGILPEVLWMCRPWRQMDSYAVIEVSSGKTGRFTAEELGITPDNWLVVGGAGNGTSVVGVEDVDNWNGVEGNGTAVAVT